MVTDATDRALLHGPQELGLHRERQLADLVQEQRAAVGGSEGALSVTVGTGKGAAYVTEQLTRGQGGSYGGGIDCDEPTETTAQPVDLLGEAVFADAALALQEHGRVGGRDSTEELSYGVHLRRREVEDHLLVGLRSQPEPCVADIERRRAA